MIRMNEHYNKLQSSYLFSTIGQKVRTFQKEHPSTRIIKMGIGDVTKPLPPSVIQAFHSGVDEMADEETFHGYGPEQGYDFLREAIAEHDFKKRGAIIEPDEIFISDGAKCDTGNIQELFARDITIAVQDPVYPVYVDTNVMAGRTGEWSNNRYSGLFYIEATEANDYVPDPPEEGADLIYLCYPNNPTGSAADKNQLTNWVHYARKNKALLLFDAAYEAFIHDDTIPHSIYEIEGAEEVAIEFRSFSKTAGFTGTRCAFLIIPKACRIFDQEGGPQMVHPLWSRRHTTKFNGVSFPVQRAAAAIYTPQGQSEVKENIEYYLENARLIRNEIKTLGYPCTGGIHSPYIWIKTGKNSWDFFDHLLNDAAVVCTPGTGFGKCGEGHIRLSAFNSRENVVEALERIHKVM